VSEDSKIGFTLRAPSFAGGITVKMAKKLTLLEEEQLKQISTRARSDMFDRHQRVIQQVSENRKTTDSDVLAFTVCSACGFTLRAIKNGTLSRLLSGSITSGLICNNEKCSFYLKLIPVNKAAELTNVAFIQQVTVATENFLKEHPEYRKK
jgi:hypothetical protein